MRRHARPPLPTRGGLDPARLKLPSEGPWRTLRDHLVERLPMVDPARIDEMLRGGEIVDREGPLGPDTPFVPDAVIWFHRDRAPEVPVPFPIDVLYQDDTLVVAHKPHFMATIPRGKHVTETALVRLRTQLDLPRLSPAHRLDRATAGLLLFVVRPEHRGAYQTMFARGKVTKQYQAIAPVDPALELPRTVRSRIVKERGIIAAYEEPGPVNAVTEVELLEQRGELGHYLLSPATGRTHQLRLHMYSLGIPILGDPFYPVVTEKPLDDFSRPLQLLAAALSFTDPVTGQQRHFESPGRLQAWEDYQSWIASA